MLSSKRYNTGGLAMICRWCKHWKREAYESRVYVVGEKMPRVGPPVYSCDEGRCTAFPFPQMSRGDHVGPTRYYDACPWYRVDEAQVVESQTDPGGQGDGYGSWSKHNRERLGTYPWSELTDAERDWEFVPVKKRKRKKQPKGDR